MLETNFVKRGLEKIWLLRAVNSDRQVDST